MSTEKQTSIMCIGRNHYTIVDTKNLPRLSKHRWFASKNKNTYYAHRQEDGKNIYMHHEVLGIVGQGKEADHRNGNGLDNRECNLRECTHQQNLQNQRKRKNCSSQYKGVWWSKNARKWQVQITCLDGTKKHIGYFDFELDAAKAYDEKAKEIFGSFANLNIPEKPKDADRLFPE